MLQHQTALHRWHQKCYLSFKNINSTWNNYNYMQLNFFSGQILGIQSYTWHSSINFPCQKVLEYFLHNFGVIKMIFVIQECKIYLKQFQLHASIIVSVQIQGTQSCNWHKSILDVRKFLNNFLTPLWYHKEWCLPFKNVNSFWNNCNYMKQYFFCPNSRNLIM